MAYLVSDSTAQWLRESMGTQTAGNRRQYLPRFQTRGGGTADGARILQITGGNPLHGFSALAYPTYDAYSSGQSGTPCTYFPADIGLGGTIPVGTLVIGHPVNVRITGGSESN